MKIETIHDLLEANREGHLPGAKLIIDNDCAFLRGADGKRIAYFSLEPREILLEIMDYFEIKAEEA